MTSQLGGAACTWQTSLGPKAREAACGGKSWGVGRQEVRLRTEALLFTGSVTGNHSA